jgi:hypothetical protein
MLFVAVQRCDAVAANKKGGHAGRPIIIKGRTISSTY